MKKILTLLFIGGAIWFLYSFLTQTEDENEVKMIFKGCVLPMPDFEYKKSKDRSRMIKIGIPKFPITAEGVNKTEYYEAPNTEEVKKSLIMCGSIYCAKLSQKNISIHQEDSLMNAYGDCLEKYCPPNKLKKIKEKETKGKPISEWNIMTSESVNLKGFSSQSFKQLEFVIDVPVRYDWYLINAFQYKNGVPYKYKFKGINPGINYINEKHFNISEVGECPDFFLLGGVAGQKVDTLLFVKNWCKPFVVKKNKKFQVHNSYDQLLGFIDSDIRCELN